MNLEDAIEVHAEWKLRFQSVMSKKGSFNVETVSKDNLCMLGNWLYSEEKKLRKYLSYKPLLESHKKFHIEAGKVASMVNSGNYAEAENELLENSSYSKASAAVCIEIMNLKNEAGM